MPPITPTPAPTAAPSPAPGLLWLPIALCFGMLLSQSGGVIPILLWLVTMLFHELGHAFMYWLSGRLAVPTFGMTVPLQESPSMFTFAAVAGALLYLRYWAKRQGHGLVAHTAVVTLGLMVLCTFVVPDSTMEQLVLLGGFGGELVLALAAMILFYQRMPRRFQWQRNRFLFLLIGASSFCSASVRWYRAQRDAAELPFGALFDFGMMFGESSESSGDLDRLIREFGWGAQDLIAFYSNLTLLCIAVLIIFYLSFLYLLYTSE